MYNDLFAVTSVRTGDFQDPQSSLSSRLSCQLPRQVCLEAKWVMAPDITLSIKISMPVKRIYGSFSGVTCCLFPTQGESKLYPTLLPKNPNPKHPSLPPSHPSKPHKTPMSLLLPPLLLYLRIQSNNLLLALLSPRRSSYGPREHHDRTKQQHGIVTQTLRPRHRPCPIRYFRLRRIGGPRYGYLRWSRASPKCRYPLGRKRRWRGS